MLNINKASRTICNESCEKSQQLQFAEIRKMVSVDPAWNILTCASQNMDEEMSKLLAVKIIQTYTANEDAVRNRKSILVVSLDNSWTLYFILDNSVLKIGNCCWLVLLSVFPAFVHWKKSVDKKWSSSVAGRVFTLSFVIPLPYNEWRRVFWSVAIFLFVFALFLHFFASL